jgi:large subunit ribosomal protein L15
MKLHTLKNTPGARASRKRVGRGPGSGMGRTSGKGHKGQMAREGHKHKFGFEGGQMPLIRRIPKRGFNHSPEFLIQPINVNALDVFNEGAEVTMQALRDKCILKGPKKLHIKILGDGDIGKKLVVKAHAFSASARAKIEAAGGRCEVAE